MLLSGHWAVKNTFSRHCQSLNCCNSSVESRNSSTAFSNLSGRKQGAKLEKFGPFLQSPLLQLAWMGTKLNRGRKRRLGTLTRGCKVAEATGKDRKSPGKKGGAGRFSSATLLAFQGRVSRHLSPGWRGRAKRQAPLTACRRHMLLEHVHTQTGMAENGMAWLCLVWSALLCSAASWADLIAAR